MLKPLEDRVLIKLMENKETTRSGIILTSNDKDKSQFAKVIEVGNGTKDVDMLVKKDDIVIIDKYAGNEIKYENENLIIVKQKEILAIVM